MVFITVISVCVCVGYMQRDKLRDGPTFSFHHSDCVLKWTDYHSIDATAVILKTCIIYLVVATLAKPSCLAYLLHWLLTQSPYVYAIVHLLLSSTSQNCALLTTKPHYCHTTRRFIHRTQFLLYRGCLSKRLAKSLVLSDSVMKYLPKAFDSLKYTSFENVLCFLVKWSANFAICDLRLSVKTIWDWFVLVSTIYLLDIRRQIVCIWLTKFAKLTWIKSDLSVLFLQIYAIIIDNKFNYTDLSEVMTPCVCDFNIAQQAWWDRKWTSILLICGTHHQQVATKLYTEQIFILLLTFCTKWNAYSSETPIEITESLKFALQWHGHLLVLFAQYSG